MRLRWLSLELFGDNSKASCLNGSGAVTLFSIELNCCQLVVGCKSKLNKRLQPGSCVESKARLYEANKQDSLVPYRESVLIVLICLLALEARGASGQQQEHQHVIQTNSETLPTIKTTFPSSALREINNNTTLHNQAITQRQIPPSRPIPAEIIQLEDGATTLVSTLEEYLDSSTSTIIIANASTSLNPTNYREFEDPLTSTSYPAAAVAIASLLKSENQTTPATKLNFENINNKDINGQHGDNSSSNAITANNNISNLQNLASATSGELRLDKHRDLEQLDYQKHDSSLSAAQLNLETLEKTTNKHEIGPHKQDKHNHNNDHHHPHHETSGGNGSSKPIPQHWQVKSLLNVTHDYPLAYSQIICGYAWPLMAALTLFTNLMIVFVLTQKDMRTPTNVVLTAIAIADIIPIVVPVPWFVYLFAMGNEKQVLYPPLVCYSYQHSTRSISEIFYFLSTWLNVLLAIQDYLTACWPKLAKKYCQIKVVIIEIVALTFLAFLLNLPQALKLVFKPVKFYYNGQLTWGCKALQAKWFKDLVGEYVALYDDIFTAIIVLFVDGGPAILLIILTALLIKQLQQQRIQGHLLMEQARTASKRRRERHRQQEYEASARVMIFVLLAFLAVKIPFATTYTLMIIQSRFEIHFVENLVDFQKAITITDLVFVLSYPINFTIFCCCSKKFRHKCAQLLSECNQNTRSTRSKLWSSMSIDSFGGGGAGSRSSSSRWSISGKSRGRQREDSLETLGSHQQGLGSTAATMTTATLGYEAKRNSLASIKEINVSNREDVHPLYNRSAMGAAKICEDLNEWQQSTRCPSSTNVEHYFAAIDPPKSIISADQQQQQQLQPIEPSGFGNMQPSELGAASMGANNSHLKSLLKDGSLCLECILRYEQMKSTNDGAASTQLAPASPSLDATNFANMVTTTNTNTNTNTTQSTDSYGWANFCLIPPPPPPLQVLPSIITTRCESIRERDSSSEETNGFVSRTRSQLSVDDGKDSKDCVGQEYGQLSLSVASANRTPTDSQVTILESSNNREEESNRQVSPSSAKRSSVGLRAQHLRRPRRGSNRISSDPGPCLPGTKCDKEAELAAVAASVAASTRTSCSDDSDKDADESNELLCGRRKRRGLGHNKLSLKLIGERQRSLSLSNSRLSTLPVATGLLADMFVSALIGAASGSGATSGAQTTDNSRKSSTQPASGGRRSFAGSETSSKRH